MGKPTIEEWIDKIIIFAFGGDMTISLSIALAISAIWSCKLWWTFRKEPNKKFPDLPKNAVIYSMIIGLFSFACLVFIISSVHSHVQESRGVLRPTDDKLIMWLSDIGFSVQKDNRDDRNWGLKVIHPINKELGVTILNPKSHPNTMEFIVALHGEGEMLKEYKVMSDAQRAKMSNELRTRLHLVGLAFNLNGLGRDNPNMDIILQEILIYDEPITKKEVYQTISKITQGMGLTRSTIQAYLGDDHKIMMSDSLAAIKN